jgi:hypothetical protein
MTRPRPGRARVRTPREVKPNLPRIGAFTVVGAAPGGATETATLDPSQYPNARSIAQTLGAQWETVGKSSTFITANQHRAALHTFLQFCDSWGVDDFAEVTPKFLREFERTLIQQVPGSAHARATAVWVMLRGLDRSVLPEPTRNLVSHAPNIPKPTTMPTEGLPDGMTARVIAAARRDIQSARSNASQSDYLTQQQLTGFFVALLWELAWSPDVLLTLNFDDVNAPTTVVDWSVAGGEQIKVRWLKNRGGGTGVELVGAGDVWSAGRILRDLEALTRPARLMASKSDNTLVPGSPWLFQHVVSGRQRVRKFPAVGDRAYLMPLGSRTTASLNGPFRWWLGSHDIEVPEEYAERISFRSIRPTAKAARVRVSDNEGLHMADIVDDHSIEVYSSRYMRHGALMHTLGETFRKDIAGKAEQFARTQPTILATIEDAPVVNLTVEQAEAALAGELEYGLTACRDPKDSPLQDAASGSDGACRFAFRSCFHCPNAVVTPAHVPRMKAIRDIGLEERVSMSPIEWEVRWESQLAFIDKALAVLEPHAPQDDDDVAVLVDLGMLEKPEW